MKLRSLFKNDDPAVLAPRIVARIARFSDDLGRLNRAGPTVTSTLDSFTKVCQAWNCAVPEGEDPRPHIRPHVAALRDLLRASRPAFTELAATLNTLAHQSGPLADDLHTLLTKLPQ